MLNTFEWEQLWISINLLLKTYRALNKIKRAIMNVDIYFTLFVSDSVKLHVFVKSQPDCLRTEEWEKICL